ncbi:MAG: cysteine--tRNA ligase [Candidatus Levybacteria bacterium RIFCSPHIGHO2_01_FULL_37_17]|nr:MAG: cysteine--tRNA ligase [Candidatus Levybacteria bacterium RIFCSPHIGHO2_01_FULL_37_17]OGH36871.1 MAG: cysteine--tRNA ligase [Candidatus Levybacteria bacterium RIFCSPLOWO2_01_FULL_38_23]
MKIYNTLSHTIEEFKPLSGKKVLMYTCGPTVYDHMHIGNLRTFVFSDFLYRTLKFNGFEVTSVQNITDIEDKIIKKAAENNKTIDQITNEYYQYFINDTQELNVPLKAPSDQPRATDYVEKMIKYIEALVNKGFAYVEKDGSVYFDISRFPNYGKLSRIDAKQLKTGTRTLSDEYTKDDAADFALWKSVSDSEFGFESPWGKGRPGWHIECSTMSQDTLGNRIDIHTGGVDLIFPHHENEIAQSEAKTGEAPFVKYWIHGAHLLVDGGKMSKSLNNFHTLADVKKRGFEPLALRYLFLQTHYRQEMNFTWEALQASQTALKRLKKTVSSYDEPKIGCAELEAKFQDAINNDLNMPRALAVVWETISSDYPSSAKKQSILLFDGVLGLGLS